MSHGPPHESWQSITALLSQLLIMTNKVTSVLPFYMCWLTWWVMEDQLSLLATSRLLLWCLYPHP